LTAGIKGVAAYTHHADMLGARDPAQYAAIQEALAFLASPQAKDVGAVLEKLLWLGGVNLKTMQMLSEAHASRCADGGRGRVCGRAVGAPFFSGGRPCKAYGCNTAVATHALKRPRPPLRPQLWRADAHGGAADCASRPLHPGLRP
jgi:hypothetical protein